MFSGIVERVGTVERVATERGSRRLVIGAPFDARLDAGESVAVNGVCLTVERADARSFEAVAVRETLDRTTLGALEAGSRVNLERALRVGQTLGGHWLQGHVDATAAIRAVHRDAGQVRLQVEIPEACRRFVANKGSIAIDGTSLTVASLSDPVAEIAIVPFTLEHTIASSYAPGVRVNLEVDLIARYLDRLLEARGALLVGEPMRTR
ncbi:MAG TPA: riboflavin synthase [Candidatus Eisenbacteria bacterium]|nr:riboflavin synthase [Candidatus Eisenbacteria bacterium]